MGKTILKDGDGDDWVEKHEFHALLLNIFWFAKLFNIFSVMDTRSDRRIKSPDSNGDDWVQKKEFKALLGNLFYFNKIFWIFDQVDGDDRRLTFPEFRKALTVCGAQMSEQEARKTFGTVDKNGG